MKRYKEMKYDAQVDGSDIEYDDSYGKKGKCEWNTFHYAKKYHMLPVKGLAIDDNGHKIEHWWVYDPKHDKHIEVTPVEGLTGERYGNIIDKESFDKIKSVEDMIKLI